MEHMFVDERGKKEEEKKRRDVGKKKVYVQKEERLFASVDHRKKKKKARPTKTVFLLGGHGKKEGRVSEKERARRGQKASFD